MKRFDKLEKTNKYTSDITNSMAESIDMLLHDRKLSGAKRMIAMTIACVVVFVTTYSLILPAVAVEEETAEQIGMFLESPSQEQLTEESAGAQQEAEILSAGMEPEEDGFFVCEDEPESGKKGSAGNGSESYEGLIIDEDAATQDGIDGIVAEEETEAEALADETQAADIQETGLLDLVKAYIFDL